MQSLPLEAIFGDFHCTRWAVRYIAGWPVAYHERLKLFTGCTHDIGPWSNHVTIDHDRFWCYQPEPRHRIDASRQECFKNLDNPILLFWSVNEMAGLRMARSDSGSSLFTSTGPVVQCNSQIIVCLWRAASPVFVEPGKTVNISSVILYKLMDVPTILFRYMPKWSQWTTFSFHQSFSHLNDWITQEVKLYTVWWTL